MASDQSFTGTRHGSSQPGESSAEQANAAAALAAANPERLEVLEQTALLDSPPEEAFDRMTRLACRVLRAPVSLVSLIDKDRQYFKSATSELDVQLPRETPLDTSFCKHTVSTGLPFIVDDASQHPLVKENLAFTRLGIVAYAGIPLTTEDGHALGSFCAIDVKPREWTPEEIGILQDLAAATLTEIELRLTARRLRHSLASLQRTESQRDNLMRMIVHDLRTPLSSFLGGVMALDSVGELNDVQKEMLSIAVAGGKSLQRMIDNLLDVARMEASMRKEGALNRTHIDAAEVVDRARGQVEQLATMTRLELRTTVEPGTPRLYVDRDMMDRVLVNLLGNALKFTPSPGCVELLAGPLDSVYNEGKAGGIHIRVRDSGPGIEPEDFEKIFQLFGQATMRTPGYGSSSGVGLAFCKLAVEAHGGRIWVESQLGQGSTFHVALPG